MQGKKKKYNKLGPVRTVRGAEESCIFYQNWPAEMGVCAGALLKK